MADKDTSGMDMLREFAVRGKHLIKLTDIANQIEREHIAEVNALKETICADNREIDQLRAELAAKRELTEHGTENVHVTSEMVANLPKTGETCQIRGTENDRYVDVEALRKLADELMQCNFRGGSADDCIVEIAEKFVPKDLIEYLITNAAVMNGVVTSIGGRIRAALEGVHEPDHEREAAADWVASHGGLGSVQMIVTWVEDNGPSISELENRLMPEGLEWPRFEDRANVEFRSRVVGICDEVEKFIFTRSQGVMCQLQDNDGCMINVMSGERVKRPKPVVLAADHRRILEGSTVYGLSDDKAWHVKRIGFGSHPVLGVSDDGFERDLRPEWLTHEQPDTPKRIEDDKRKDTLSYWGCRGKSCEECPSKIDGENPWEHYGVPICSVAQGMDIARREQELKARTMGGAR